MILITKIIIGILLLFIYVEADENNSCLAHLGGGMSDVYCYMDLTKEQDDNSFIISKKILSTMPKNTKYQKLFMDFMKAKKQERKYCELIKGSRNSWGIYDALEVKAFHVNDVDYYECVYKLSINQHDFLEDMLSGISQ
ncbi:MAG: hypothetical protein PHI47_14100 [Sulfuricurvum sp.]|uniref:hypothetical protein n=1 Tax=Sulfuricurvum sp. TaxID=2025608 RepID=UPI00262487A7|nr:hypothetical protein [Sulfuricurvum sp.]MDD5161180.1 hypothetical protein [Sulfuricurvum sp.]